jgi:hypothetical protein
MSRSLRFKCTKKRGKRKRGRLRRRNLSLIDIPNLRKRKRLRCKDGIGQSLSVCGGRPGTS